MAAYSVREGEEALKFNGPDLKRKALFLGNRNGYAVSPFLIGWEDGVDEWCKYWV